MDRASIQQHQVSVRGAIAVAPGCDGCDQGDQAQQHTGEGEKVPGEVLGSCFNLNRYHPGISGDTWQVDY